MPSCWLTSEILEIDKNMKKITFTLSLCLLVIAATSQAAPIKARVIQPCYALEDGGLVQSYLWEIGQLEKCDPSLDMIVLSEFSDVPGKATTEEFFAQVDNIYDDYRKILSETARRCSAIVIAGVVEKTGQGPRNATLVYKRDGTLAGVYYKQHLTRGEWANKGLDRSYTQEWSAPTMLEVEGLKLAFLTCYDFYYYENFANIARYKPDIIIGCSHQRSDPHSILGIINSFCAYNTGAYIVRCSVSMGEESPVGGCSCFVAPTGEILGNLYSRQDVLDAVFDPAVKYLKPAGYGNPPSMHSDYMGIGRRPWKYRPGGSAVVPFIDEAPEQRICAMNGMKLHGAPLMARIGAAVGENVGEVCVKITPGDPTAEKVLAKFACHTILNFKLEGNWDEQSLEELHGLLFDYDACRHTCLSSESADVLKIAEVVCPEIQLCLQTTDSRKIEDAHKAGYRVCAMCRRKSGADKLFALGVDTAVVSNWKQASRR